MQHRVPRHVDVLREAAPQVRGLLVGRIAVADRVRVGAPVGVLAVAVLALVAPLALAAHHVVLEEDEIAFLEALAARELGAALGDVADVLVAHDGGLVGRRLLVEAHVRAADAGDLHLEQRRVGRHVRHRILADLGGVRGGTDGGQHFFCHGASPSAMRLSSAGIAAARAGQARAGRGTATSSAPGEPMRVAAFSSCRAKCHGRAALPSVQCLSLFTHGRPDRGLADGRRELHLHLFSVGLPTANRRVSSTVLSACRHARFTRSGDIHCIGIWWPKLPSNMLYYREIGWARSAL